jgi:hypothetical protein
MKRARVEMDPREFAFVVSLARRTAQTALRSDASSVFALMRDDHSYPNFQEAIRRAGPARRVLALGGATDGYCALDPDYTATEWTACWPDSAVDSLALNPEAIRNPGRLPRDHYDAVISTSLVLFLYSLEELGALLEHTLKQGGRYVFGKEVNARFFRNHEVMARLKEWRARRHEGASVRKRIRRFWRGLFPAANPVETAANRILREKHGFAVNLKTEEFRAMIEIHRPAEPPTATQVGLYGFDVEELASSIWPFLQLNWWKSSGHLGYAPHSLLDPHWKGVEADLAARYPDDGVYLSACFTKQ